MNDFERMVELFTALQIDFSLPVRGEYRPCGMDIPGEDMSDAVPKFAVKGVAISYHVFCFDEGGVYLGWFDWEDFSWAPRGGH